MDREVAAKALGYSGISGRSATVLANLIQYGLLERAGKNEVRVSRRAVDIIHPDSAQSKAEALRSAALEPELFQKVAARFVDGLPSENALHSFLVREGFTDTAIPAAARAFLETSEFLKNAIGKGSSSVASPGVVDSASTPHVERNDPMAHPSTPSAKIDQGASAPPMIPTSLNSTKPIFDFESVAINTRIDNQEDLAELLLRLEQIKSMLPKRTES